MQFLIGKTFRIRALAIAFSLAALFSCTKDSEAYKLFFRKEATNPLELDLILSLRKDTLYMSKKAFLAEENLLKYKILQDSEIDELSLILDKVKRMETTKLYGSLKNHDSRDWGFYYRDLSDTVNIRVIENGIPKILKPLYTFLLDKSQTNDFTNVRNNGYCGNEIAINSIIEKSSGKEKNFSGWYENDALLYSIWKTLMMADFSLEEKNIIDYEYVVNFSYILNADTKCIEEIFLNLEDNKLIVKFKNSEVYRRAKIDF